MTFYISKPKDPSGYAIASTTKWSESRSVVTFDECKVRLGDDFIYLRGFAKSFSDIKDFKDKEWQFTPQKIAIKIACKNWEKTFDGKTTPVAQSGTEKILAGLLSELVPEMTYAGTIDLSYNSFHDSWEHLQPAMHDAFSQTMVSLKPLVGEIKHTTDNFEPPVYGAGGFSGQQGRSGLSPYDKAKSAEKYLLEVYQAAYPDKQFKSIADLLLIEKEEAFWTLMGLYREVIGGVSTK